MISTLSGITFDNALISRRDCGSIEHRFTHIVQRLFVEHIVLSVPSMKDFESALSRRTQVRLVKADRVARQAISRGSLKCFELVTSATTATNTKSKRAKK
jgi:hypothetical protein